MGFIRYVGEDGRIMRWKTKLKPQLAETRFKTRFALFLKRVTIDHTEYMTVWLEFYEEEQRYEEVRVRGEFGNYLTKKWVHVRYYI